MEFVKIEQVEGKSYLKATAGIYSKILGYTQRFFWPDSFKSVSIDCNYDHVVLKTESEVDVWKLSYKEEDEALKVESVLGVTPTDNFHLMELLADLRSV